MSDNNAPRKSRSSCSPGSRGSSMAPRRKSSIAPSKIKLLFHKVKKALRVGKTTPLPEEVQNNFAQVKSYRDELAQLAEAIKGVTLPNPVEARKAGPGLQNCQSSENHDSYEQFYAILVYQKKLFEKYECYDRIMRAAYDLAQESREHQKTTEKLFADVTEFLNVDYPNLEKDMKMLTELRDSLDYLLCQKPSNLTETRQHAEETGETQTRFKELSARVTQLTKEIMKSTSKHVQALPAWIDSRRAHHTKMEQILKKAIGE